MKKWAHFKGVLPKSMLSRRRGDESQNFSSAHAQTRQLALVFLKDNRRSRLKSFGPHALKFWTLRLAAEHERRKT
jgi:hypothetical protein